MYIAPGKERYISLDQTKIISQSGHILYVSPMNLSSNSFSQIKAYEPVIKYDMYNRLSPYDQTMIGPAYDGTIPLAHYSFCSGEYC